MLTTIRKGLNMLFVVIRLAFLGIVFMVNFLLIRKSRSIYKCRWLIIAFVAAVMLTTISAFLPIENAFVHFSSPESAYSYNHSGSVKLVVEGKNTAFVVGGKGDTDVYAIVPKFHNAWKMGMGLDTKRVAQTVSGGITIDVYQYKNTNDYYITVLDTNGGVLDIADNHKSTFVHVEKANSTLNKSFYTYYTFIDGFDETYSITVNGKSTKLKS